MNQKLLEAASRLCQIASHEDLARVYGEIGLESCAKAYSEDTKLVMGWALDAIINKAALKEWRETLAKDLRDAAATLEKQNEF